MGRRSMVLMLHSKIPKYPLVWDEGLEPLVRDVIERIAECTSRDREPSCDQS